MACWEVEQEAEVKNIPGLPDPAVDNSPATVTAAENRPREILGNMTSLRFIGTAIRHQPVGFDSPRHSAGALLEHYLQFI